MSELTPVASEEHSVQLHADCRGDADCGHVICQPVLWLNRVVILGGVSGKGESLGELLSPNAVPETRWAGCSLLFSLCISFQQLNAMPGIVLADLTSTEP